MTAVGTVAAAAGRTGAAVRDAAREARGAWSRRASLTAGAVAAAAAVPVFAAPLTLDGLAATLYTALAAIGLGYALGIGGMPSLAQGAFVAIGAVAAAAATVHLDVPALAAAVLGLVAAAAAGIVVGAAVVRLRAAFVAVGTWMFAWLVGLGLLAFPSLSGGAQGRVVPPGTFLGIDLDPAFHYELGLALVVVASLGFAALTRGSAGIRAIAAHERPAAAAALAVPTPRLRLGLFSLAAAVGGLAGGLGVLLAGVSDPVSYGPALSFTLFAAVLVGGARRAAGGLIGAVLLGLLGLAAGRVADFSGVATGRLNVMLEAVLVLSVLALAAEGILPWAEARRPRATVAARRAAAGARHGATLVARGLSKRFGEVVALEDLTLELRPGTVTAVIGANGSGKTTALRLLSGTLAADSGELLLDGTDVGGTTRSDRVRLGIVRTLQATAVFGELTTLENVAVGAGARARYGGVARSLLATPRARTELRAAREQAASILDGFGLGDVADVRASELPASQQRLTMIAAAYATTPRVLLLDEPSAGASPADVARLAAIVDRLRREGIAIAVVEHNLRLVRTVADRVIVLEAGRTIADGTPDEVARDPAVQAAYLGRERDER